MLWNRSTKLESVLQQIDWYRSSSFMKFEEATQQSRRMAKAIPTLIVLCVLCFLMFAACRSAEFPQPQEPTVQHTSAIPPIIPLATQPVEISLLTPTRLAPSLTNTINTPSAFADVPVSIFGVDDRGTLTTSDIARTLAKQAGARWIRVSVNWASVEPTHTTPDHYNWTTTDATLPPLLEAGFLPYVYVMGNPPWASNTDCGPVKNPQQLAEFMGALATRYPEVPLWGLYNEIDNVNYQYSAGGCFGLPDLDHNGAPDYADYANMLKASWQAIHTANTKANLTMGSIAFDNFNESSCPSGYPGRCGGGSFNYDFLTDLMEYIRDHPLPADRRYMDAIAFDYYPVYGLWWESRVTGYHGLVAKAEAIRQIERTVGLDLPLIVVESGDYSHDEKGTLPAVCPENGIERQSRSVLKLYTEAYGAGVQALFWWTFADVPLDPNHPETKDWDFGLVTAPTADPPYVLKPAYVAYHTLTTELNGFEYSGPFGTDASIEGYTFTNSSAQKTILWSVPCERGIGDSRARIAIFGPNVVRLRVLDKWGNGKSIDDNGAVDQDKRAGYVGIVVGGSPLIVQIDP